MLVVVNLWNEREKMHTSSRKFVWTAGTSSFLLSFSVKLCKGDVLQYSDCYKPLFINEILVCGFIKGTWKNFGFKLFHAFIDHNDFDDLAPSKNKDVIQTRNAYKQIPIVLFHWNCWLTTFNQILLKNIFTDTLFQLFSPFARKIPSRKQDFICQTHIAKTNTVVLILEYF